jgi:hypothetical protein
MRKPRSLDDDSKTEVGYAPKPSGYLLHRMAELGFAGRLHHSPGDAGLLAPNCSGC